MLGHEDWFTRKNAIDALEFAAEPEDDAVMTALSLSMQDVSATVRYGRSRGARVSRGRVLSRSCLASCPRLTASSSSSPRPLCLLLFCLTGSRQYRVLCSLRESERMPSTRCAHLAFSPSDGYAVIAPWCFVCVDELTMCIFADNFCDVCFSISFHHLCCTSCWSASVIRTVACARLLPTVSHACAHPTVHLRNISDSHCDQARQSAGCLCHRCIIGPREQKDPSCNKRSLRYVKQ